jgi:hypothetical protein
MTVTDLWWVSLALALRRIDPNRAIKSGRRLVCARLKVNDP